MFRPLDEDGYDSPAIMEPESPVSNNNNNNNNIKYKTESIQEENKNLLAPPPYNQIVRSLSFGNEAFTAKTNGKSQNGHTNKNGEEKARLATSLSQPLLNDPNHIGWHIKRTHSGTLDRVDAFYMGSTQNIARQRSQLSLNTADRYGSMRRRSNNEEVEQVQVCGCIPCSEETHDTIKKMMSFGLLKDPVFLLFIASNFLTRYVIMKLNFCKNWDR